MLMETTGHARNSHTRYHLFLLQACLAHHLALSINIQILGSVINKLTIRFMSCGMQSSCSASRVAPVSVKSFVGQSPDQQETFVSKFCKCKRGEKRMKAQGQSDTEPAELGQRAVIKCSQVRNMRNSALFLVYCRNKKLEEETKRSVQNNPDKGLSQLSLWF